MASNTVSQKKRGRPATGQSPRLGVRLAPEVLSTFEAWLSEFGDPKPSQSDGIRFLMLRSLELDGFVPADALTEPTSRPEIAIALDKAIASEPDHPNQSTMLRRILRSWLTERGFLRPARPDEGKRPDQLDAENDG